MDKKRNITMSHVLTIRFDFRSVMVSLNICRGITFIVMYHHQFPVCVCCLCCVVCSLRSRSAVLCVCVCVVFAQWSVCAVWCVCVVCALWSGFSVRILWD